jgi:hypothetical protein
MFMWMLHDDFRKKMQYRNVYVNVTQLLWKDNAISKCLCECYMITSERKWNIEMFMWMLHSYFEKLMQYQNVYVNVTWQLQKENEISKCLYECYIASKKKSDIEMFKWMLHGCFEKIMQ